MECKLSKNAQTKGRLNELCLLFLKLGFTAFGGPAAHIAMMEEEIVRKRAWLSNQEFLDLLGATNLLPGPNSTEMAIHIGKIRAGWSGLVVAGISFIFPAMVIVMAIAWGYSQYGALPAASQALYGVKPVIIAILMQVLVSFGRSAIKSIPLAVIAALAIVVNLMNASELLVLVVAGLITAAIRSFSIKNGKAYELGTGFLAAISSFQPAMAQIVSEPSLKLLFLTFLKIGSVLYGSGYVLLAFLKSHFVEQYGLITESQLIDAIAVGQFTPGPVFTTATFIGHIIRGFPGAIASTIGIFLPAFIFVAASSFLIPKIAQSHFVRNLLDGVNVASLSLMFTVTLQLCRSSIIDATCLSILCISLVLLMKFKINSAYLILGGSIAGLIAS